MAPSLFKTTWSHQGPRNSNSIGSSRPVDPPGQAGGVLIAERKKSYSKCPQCAGADLGTLMASKFNVNMRS